MVLGWRRRTVLAVALVVAAMVPALAGTIGLAQTNDDGPKLDHLPGVGELTPYRGDLHAHTSYSDGEDTPERAFHDAHEAGWLDFFAVTEHSEWFLFPFKADEDCIGPQGLECRSTPLPDRTEWHEIGFQADRYTDHDFLAMRGFEWSSFVEGHVNVYETRVWTDSVQTGQAPMTGLYAWLAGEQLDPDRYATFNHPGREPLMFDNFTYVPSADEHLVSLESFNRDDDYSDTYLAALDEGWHLGTHGVTDGHDAPARLNPGWGHTVALMDSFTKDGLRRAMEQHHTVATQGSDQDARLFVDGQLMGDVVTGASKTVSVELTLLDAGKTGPDTFEKVELLGPQGFQRTLDVGGDAGDGFIHVETEVTVDDLPTTELGERYLTARAYQLYDGEVRPTVVTSAVWIER